MPSIESLSEKPFSSAVASTIALNVEPGWRPYGLGIVARLNWVSSNPVGPATIARTSPLSRVDRGQRGLEPVSGSVLSIAA